MDAVVRSLRDGRLDSGQAPLLLLEDTLATVGGPAIFLQVVAELASCISQGRAQAQALTLVALDGPPSHYQLACQSLRPAQLSILDCFSDPYGWREQETPSAVTQPSSPSIISLSGTLRRPDSLQQLQLLLAGPSHPPQCLVVDSLSRLLDGFGAQAVSQWLHQLQRGHSTSCVLCALHVDLHPPTTLGALHYLATGWAQLQPLSQLERALGTMPAPGPCPPSALAAAAAGALPHGRLAVRLKRRAGRVRAEAQLYRVEAGSCLGAGNVAYWDAPAIVPESVAAAAAATAAEGPSPTSSASAAAAMGRPAATGSRPGDAAARAGAGAGLGVQMQGGMKLSLTREEEEARRRVQLPYEHQGESAAYQTGDFRDYLPPEAGGHAGSTGGARRLGHILYVRDSGSEHDSDEDLDDDLDL